MAAGGWTLCTSQQLSSKTYTVFCVSDVISTPNLILIKLPDSLEKLNWKILYFFHCRPRLLKLIPIFLYTQFPARNKQDAILTEDDYQDWSSEEGSQEAGPSTAPPHLPDLIIAIENAISELGGSVVPKLTWSVPKDAIWMSVGNTLRCHTSDQVLLLLKSSDRVGHDISDALAQCENATARSNTITNDTTQTSDSHIATTDGVGTINGPAIEHVENVVDEAQKGSHMPSMANVTSGSTTSPPEGHILALRKWYDLRPGREFRCFVINNHLVGISQRDVSRRYEELEAEYDILKDRIERFHNDVIVPGQFGHMTDFTYDCYVPTSPGAAVRLIDINPSGGTTAALLFEWEELLLLSSNSHRSNKSSISDPNNSARGGDEYRHSACGDDASSRSTEGPVIRNGNYDDYAGVDFRIIREDIALRPDTALYGVPYDFIDFSEGSALSALMEQAQQGNIGTLN